MYCRLTCSNSWNCRGALSHPTQCPLCNACAGPASQHSAVFIKSHSTWSHFTTGNWGAPHFLLDPPIHLGLLPYQFLGFQQFLLPLFSDWPTSGISGFSSQPAPLGGKLIALALVTHPALYLVSFFSFLFIVPCFSACVQSNFSICPLCYYHTSQGYWKGIGTVTTFGNWSLLDLMDSSIPPHFSWLLFHSFQLLSWSSPCA